jgi:hypothetical protein
VNGRLALITLAHDVVDASRDRRSPVILEKRQTREGAMKDYELLWLVALPDGKPDSAFLKAL